MKRLLFDIEGNGYLRNVTKLWCCVVQDLDTGVTRRYSPLDWDEAERYLQSADVLIGHNIIAYDLPAIWKVRHGSTDCPWDECPLITDTLVVSYALWPERKGGHSLEAWGKRLGEYKGDYTGGFDAYSQEMLEYCEQDVIVNVKLYHQLADDVEEQYGTPLKGYKVY